MAQKAEEPNVFFEVGSIHAVGSFFWTAESKCIGFAPDAVHGHELSFGSSVEPGDDVEVLGIEGDEVVVKVLKHHLPYGAPCPHGMIVLLPAAQIAAWPEQIARAQRQNMRRREMAERYGASLT